MDIIQQLYDKRNAEQVARNAAYKPPRSVTFRASEVHGCARQIYHRLVGDHPAPGNARGDDYGRGGDAAHDVVRRLLNEYGFKVGQVDEGVGGMTETKAGIASFTDQAGTKVTFTARLDGDIALHDGSTALLEIKSIGSYDYRKLSRAFSKKGADTLMAQINKEHEKFVWQCMVGMAVHNYDKSYLVIYDRESCATGVRNDRTGEIMGGPIIPFDDELFQSIVNKCGRIARAVAAKSPVRAQYLDGSRECGWCSYYSFCHGAAKG